MFNISKLFVKQNNRVKIQQQQRDNKLTRTLYAQFMRLSVRFSEMISPTLSALQSIPIGINSESFLARKKTPGPEMFVCRNMVALNL